MMAFEPSKQYYKVGVLLIPGGDILDFAGPIEVLSHVSHNQNPDNPDRMFDIHTIATSSRICAANTLTVQTDILLPEAIDRISDFHVLIIPGGPPSVLKPLLNHGVPELDLIRKFAALPDTSSGPRILLSVCTGAFLLGASGILAGMSVTTHHRGVDTLREICARFHSTEDPPTTVTHERYLDGGLLKGGGVRLITAGGVSSGLDAAFYLVSQLATHDMAAFVTRVMEYDWHKVRE